MDQHAWLDTLTAELDAVRADGIPDREVALALMAIRSGHPMEEKLLPHAETIWRLAWALNVRAPALDLHWLVKGVLATDKVYWEVVTLDELIGLLSDLERAVADHHRDVEAWLTTKTDDPELTRIRALAADLPLIASAQGPALEERVKQAIFLVQNCVERSDLLDQAIPPGPRG